MVPVPIGRRPIFSGLNLPLQLCAQVLAVSMDIWICLTDDNGEDRVHELCRRASSAYRAVSLGTCARRSLINTKKSTGPR